jgi:hypothetical protein
LIILNVGMYFVAPAVVIHTIRKKFYLFSWKSKTETQDQT